MFGEIITFQLCKQSLGFYKTKVINKPLICIFVLCKRTSVYDFDPVVKLTKLKEISQRERELANINTLFFLILSYLYFKKMPQIVE